MTVTATGPALMALVAVTLSPPDASVTEKSPAAAGVNVKSAPVPVATVALVASVTVQAAPGSAAVKAKAPPSSVSFLSATIASITV